MGGGAQQAQPVGATQAGHSGPRTRKPPQRLLVAELRPTHTGRDQRRARRHQAGCAEPLRRRAAPLLDDRTQSGQPGRRSAVTDDPNLGPSPTRPSCRAFDRLSGALRGMLRRAGGRGDCWRRPDTGAAAAVPAYATTDRPRVAGRSRVRVGSHLSGRRGGMPMTPAEGALQEPLGTCGEGIRDDSSRARGR